MRFSLKVPFVLLFVVGLAITLPTLVLTLLAFAILTYELLRAPPERHV